MVAPRSSPIAASVTMKIKYVARFVRQWEPSMLLRQARTSIRMHSVKAYVMPHHTVTLRSCRAKTLHHYINRSAQHFEI